MRRLYIDCDGVLADFDKRATRIFGEDPRLFEDKYGSDAFWAVIRADIKFFQNLEPLEDGLALMRALDEYKPIILTGCPSQIPEGHFQKQEWVKNRFGSRQPVITCQSKNKSNFCRPGDIIIDDFEKHRAAWEEVGGIWITHTSFDTTMQEFMNVIKDGF